MAALPNFVNIWNMPAGRPVGTEIPLSPVNTNIGTYGWRSIGVPSITISINAFAAAYLSGVNNDANRANSEVLWVRQVKSNASPLYTSGALIRGSGTAGSEGGYYCYMDEAAGNLVVAKIVSGTLTSLQTFAITLPAAEEDYYIRFRVNTTTIKAKAWRYDAPEPAAWQISFTDVTISAAGYVGFATQCKTTNNAGFHTPGFISVGTNGETAPRPRTETELRNWADDDSNERIVIAELGVLGTTNGTTANPSLVLLSNWPFITKGGSERNLNQCYDDIITRVPTMRTAANEQLVGRSTLSFGDLVIKNEDGVRDNWLVWNWDGQPCDMYMGGVGWRSWDFIKVLSATISEVYAPSRFEIGFKMRDRAVLLDRKLQTNLIGGSDANAGAPQPVLFGKCFNIEPVLKSGSTLRYKFHDGDMTGSTGILAVRDSGAAVTPTADLPNGEFTLSATPGGRVTMDAYNDLTGGSVTKSGNIHSCAIQTLIEDRAALGANACYNGGRSGSLANFGTAAVVGLYARSDVNILNLLDNIAISAGGFWYSNAIGVYCAQVLVIPSAPYDNFIEEDDIADELKIEKIILPSEAEQLGYQPNWTIQADGLVGNVSAANRALYGAPAQYTAIAPSYSGLDQPANHALRGRPTARLTLFYNSADAVTEATRLDALHRKTCAIFTFRTRRGAPFYDLGQSVLITSSRYGFDLGKAGMIVGVEKSPDSASATLRVYAQLDGKFPVTTVAAPYVTAEDFY